MLCTVRDSLGVVVGQSRDQAGGAVLVMLADIDRQGNRLRGTAPLLVSRWITRAGGSYTIVASQI